MTSIIYRGHFLLRADVKVYITIHHEPQSGGENLYFASGWIRGIPMSAGARAKVSTPRNYATITETILSFFTEVTRIYELNF
jgi:hypothetical protein